MRNLLIALGAAAVVVVAVVLGLAFGLGWGTTQASDEDQIRAVVAEIQTAWNNSDYHFAQTRKDSGEVTFTVKTVTSSGDSAAADTTDTFTNTPKPQPDTLPFKKDDGAWKYCTTS